MSKPEGRAGFFTSREGLIPCKVFAFVSHTFTVFANDTIEAAAVIELEKDYKDWKNGTIQVVRATDIRFTIPGNEDKS